MTEEPKVRKVFRCPECGRTFQTVIWSYSLNRSRNEAYCLCTRKRDANGCLVGDAPWCPEVVSGKSV